MPPGGRSGPAVPRRPRAGRSRAGRCGCPRASPWARPVRKAAARSLPREQPRSARRGFRWMRGRLLGSRGKRGAQGALLGCCLRCAGLILVGGRQPRCNPRSRGEQSEETCENLYPQPVKALAELSAFAAGWCGELSAPQPCGGGTTHSVEHPGPLAALGPLEKFFKRYKLHIRL